MSIADRYFKIVTRRRRMLLLLFVAGFSWGYVVKTVMRVHVPVGFHDPSVIVADELYQEIAAPKLGGDTQSAGEIEEQEEVTNQNRQSIDI